jgi:hypothetical protein
MNPSYDEASSNDWTETTAMAAPALLGAAAGLILGEMMHSSARRAAALGLATLGLAAVLPFAVGGIVNKVNSPTTKRGARRRLEGIRSSGAGGQDLVDEGLSEMGIL